MSRQKRGQHSAKALLITSSQFWQRAQSFKITILLQPSNHSYQLLTADQIRKKKKYKSQGAAKKSKAFIDNSSTEESSAEDEENNGNEEADIGEDSNALITELYELE